ncbi:MAG TPA: hypothetical protein VGG92_15155 [Caulobacteraceae bacterium]
MTWILACLLLSAAPPAPDSAADFDARIAASAAQAERLQGPLDGAWVLRDRRGRPLMRLQIVDPAQSVSAATGAWSLADGSAMGSIEKIDATRERLTVELSPDERLVLRREPGLWRGRLTKDGRIVVVTLARR